MKQSIFKYSRGKLRRWYRKTFHKSWGVVDHGLFLFQEFADIFGDTINDIDEAERFFTDFMRETHGWVIVDFLDTDNWDCIRKVEVDKQNGLVWFYWQIPSGDPVEEMMRRMAFPLGYYGMCLKFDSVRFVKGKHKRCFGIIVNGYTIREKNVKGFSKNGGWEIKGIDSQSSFFAVNLVRGKEKVLQSWRFMNVDRGTLTLHLIKIVSEELLIIRLIPYLCCLKEEKADRKGNLFRGQQSFRVYEPS